MVCPAGPGCLVCPWAAARPRAVRAASFARRVVSKPGQALPPPTGTAAWPAGDTTPIRPARPLACLQSLSKRLHRGCPKMSHVIPLRVFQILNSRRWNCNVFGWSRKMTEGNYVRNLSGPGPLSPTGTAAGSSGPSGALRTSAACAYGRPTTPRRCGRPGPPVAQQFRT